MGKEIVYASKTGHSKKIAEAIAKELNLKVQDISQKPKLENVDLLYIVGGIYGGKSQPELLNYLDTLDNTMVKKAVLMTSSASGKTGQEDVREVLTKKGIEVAKEEFVCPGSFLIVKMKHPNQEDIREAVEFAKKLGGI